MTDHDVTTVPTDDVDYYGRISYWNWFEEVRARLNERSTGDRNLTWHGQLGQRRRFQRALVLNCGNGWVEHALLREGLIETAVGVDISRSLIEQASANAARDGLNATYHVLDVNIDSLPDGPFDFVVNYAACHHIASLDRVFSEVLDRMSADGLFVTWDYVGPHRNQYTARQWERAWTVNERLPVHLRNEMHYPLLDTMLREDPTEAVHSELIVPTMKRYLDIETFRPLGGAVGYVLLTHNLVFYSSPLDEVSPWIEMIMDEDERYLREAPADTLFAYIVARPKRPPPDATERTAWQSDERERERLAAANNGEYYPRTTLSVLYRDLERMVPPTFRAVASRRWPALAAHFRALRVAVRRSKRSVAASDGRR